jgi:hypothetical protein
MMLKKGREEVIVILFTSFLLPALDYEQAEI